MTNKRENKADVGQSATFSKNALNPEERGLKTSASDVSWACRTLFPDTDSTVRPQPPHMQPGPL